MGTGTGAEAHGAGAGGAGAGGFAAATGTERGERQEDGGWGPRSGKRRAAEVRTAFEGLLEIRRLTNARGPANGPAVWELRQPVRAVALALEAGGMPPSAVDAEGRPCATGYCVIRATGPEGEPTGPVRVYWRGPRGSGVRYEQQEALQRCVEILREAGWATVECRADRERWLEVEPEVVRRG
ncbi:hypothetical protein [Streptomyces sp. NPDC050504]|uniref:hypothetical protein n=1 Tax=Streptomyces sp. NPDC050504 TaxID=3365618 RepID=UPI0037A43CBD